MTHQPWVVGIMGGSSCNEEQYQQAFELGSYLAKKGLVVLTGGGQGVMEAASKGAQDAGGLTIGILPGPDKSRANPYVSVCIVTNLGDARNPINILSSDLVLAIGGSGGTLSEIALALKNGKQVIGLSTCVPVFSDGQTPRRFLMAQDLDEAKTLIDTWLNERSKAAP